MAIEGFDYKTFAQELASQASGLLPREFQDFQKQYVANTIQNFATLCGEAVYNDDKANFTAEQAMLITQIIAEWSFHKSVDIIKAGILPEYWDGIMQKIAFTIFEIGKQTIQKGLPQDEILQIVEHHVKKTYESVLQELKERQVINDDMLDIAMHQSNIDDMMQTMQEETEELEKANQSQQVSNNEASGNVNPNYETKSKVLKLASVALLLQQVSQDKVQTILNKFDSQDAQAVIQYMQMTDLDAKVDKDLALRCLQEIKVNLPEPKFISSSRLISRLGLLFEKLPKERIETLVINERPKVREFIEKAYDGDLMETPSKVANIIVQHLEDCVS
jgi:hypothetical protein